jgi:hypothetical protein
MSQPEALDQHSPMVVTFMTTEHFVLQTARSAGITETVGRAAIYLAAVSSGLVALAFTGQLSRLGAAFYVFGLVLLLTLAFVGLTTFDRALHNAVEDVQLVVITLVPFLARPLAAAGIGYAVLVGWSRVYLGCTIPWTSWAGQASAWPREG